MALSETNKLLVAEVTTLQKMVGAQKQSQQEMLNFLSHPADDWRSGRHHPHSAGGMGGPVGMHPDDEPPELRRARELLSSVTPNQNADRELERINGVYQGAPGPTEALSLMLTQAQPHMLPTPINDDQLEMRHLVYPVGQEGGIDPFHSDHIHKIPYGLPTTAAPATTMVPASNGMSVEAPQVPPPPGSDGSRQGAARLPSLWGPKRPTILLVEDDRTCSRIGAKFLQQLGCTVEVAVCCALFRLPPH